MDNEAFRAVWRSLCREWDLRDSGETIERLLVGLYCDPHRGYHTGEHVIFCLDRLDENPGLTEDLFAVSLGLMFHDCIYNPFSADNERNSANLLLMAMERLDPDKTFSKQEAYGIILATKHDLGPDMLSPDQKLACDIDLCIMGFPWPRFAQTKLQIRKEYSFVPESIYRKKRAEVLSGFLKRPNIFLTDIFRENYEARAQENLLREVKNLESI